jgi:hypothetical protein
VSSELVATLNYPCPHCRVELDLPATSWDGWMRCPSCERTFLPPEPERLPRGMSAAAVPSPLDGSPLTDGRMAAAPEFEGPHPLTRRMAHTSPTRLVFTTGFVLCLFLTLISFLDLRPVRLAIFGFLTIGFLLLLLRTPRRRLPPFGST